MIAAWAVIHLVDDEQGIRIAPPLSRAASWPGQGDQAANLA